MMAKEYYKVGDLVEFVDEIEHKRCPRYYPKVGTVGRVVAVPGELNLYMIQWPEGSTSADDR